MLDDAWLAPELPFALQLELTSRCNLRCRMCPLTTGTSSSSGSPGPTTEATWEQVRPIARRSQQVFVAGYGEPLTNPQCLELLRDLDDHGVQVSMASNGLSITAANAAELAALRHFTELNVSIDSPDPVLYRDIRVGNVHRALAGLRHAVDALGPARVQVSSVLMRQNAASLAGFPALLASYGVRRYTIQGLVDYNDYARGSTLLGEPDLAAEVAAIRAACEAHDVQLHIGTPERLALELSAPTEAVARFHDRAATAPTRQCMVPWEVPFVDKDGRVFPCCNAAAADQSRFGDVHEERFEDIWVGATARAFRAALLDGATTPEVCRGCTVAPLGEHPVRTWAAEVVPGSVRVRRGRVSFRVANRGTRTWTRDDLVRVGLRASGAHHPAWPFPTRPATFEEREVPPGATGTFRFPVTAGPVPVTQRFHLVVEGVLWLPGATVDVKVPARRLRRLCLRRRPRPRSAAADVGFAATVVPGSVAVGPGSVRVQVRNTGTRTWTPGDHLRLGTSRPRDATSPLAHPAWLNRDRPATFAEGGVPVGGTASFEFPIGDAAPGTTQAFEVVVEGRCWIPGTAFEVSV